MRAASAGPGRPLDPALIVFGGGMSLAGEALLAPLRSTLADQLVWRDAPPILGSPLGPLGGRIGAGLIALRAAGLPEASADWSLDSVLAVA